MIYQRNYLWVEMNQWTPSDSLRLLLIRLWIGLLLFCRVCYLHLKNQLAASKRFVMYLAALPLLLLMQHKKTDECCTNASFG